MAQLSPESLHALLRLTELARVVDHPKDEFCDLVAMALEAAYTHPSPAFTLRELETMLFNCAQDDIVHMDSREFASLVKLAMLVPPKASVA
jgi:hypothetical protein